MNFNPRNTAKDRAMERTVDIKESAFPSSALDAALFDNMKSAKVGSEDNSSGPAFLLSANDKPEIKEGDHVHLSGAKSIMGRVTNIIPAVGRRSKILLVVWTNTHRIGRCTIDDLELIR